MMFVTCFFLLMMFNDYVETNDNKFGESHFAPKHKFDKTFSNHKVINILVLGLEEIEKVKVPGSNFFTSLLASRASSKSQETWVKIAKLAKKVKHKFSNLKSVTQDICYITNVQKSLLHLITEISNDRLKRSVSETGGSTTTTTTTTTVSPNEDVQKFRNIMSIVKMTRDMKDTPKDDIQKRAKLLQSIRKNLQCWVNNEDYASFTKCYEQLLLLDNLQYQQVLKDRHLTRPITDLRDDLLSLISIQVNNRITFELPLYQTYTDETACNADNTDNEVLEVDSISEQESSKRIEFCTSTPNLCIGKTPVQIIRSNLKEIGLKDKDIQTVMLETNEAELYRKASLLTARRTLVYSNPEKIIYGQLENINYTIIANQFAGVTKSDEELNNNLNPILESLKFLDVIFETKFKKQFIEIDKDLLSCDLFEGMHTFNIYGKLYSFKTVDKDLKGYYPMPFCYSFCMILQAKPYVVFDNNEVGLIDGTDSTFQNAFVLKKISSINVCAKQKTITEACTFMSIQYVQQISLLKIYDYVCTINSGCAYYLEGKIIASAFISQSEFETLNEDSDSSLIDNIFSEDGSEMVIKGIFYSLSTLLTIALVGAIRKIYKWGKTTNCKNLCECCKKDDSRPSRNIQMNTISRRNPVVTDPLIA